MICRSQHMFSYVFITLSHSLNTAEIKTTTRRVENFTLHVNFQSFLSIKNILHCQHYLFWLCSISILKSRKFSSPDLKRYIFSLYLFISLSLFLSLSPSLSLLLPLFLCFFSSSLLPLYLELNLHFIVLLTKKLQCSGRYQGKSFQVFGAEKR